jgi:hypothetical protein
MTDTDKYIKLLGTIILTFVGFIIALALVILGLRYIFGLLDFMPWFSVMFTLIIICVPALLFITVYLIYVRHTKPHPSRAAKIFSYIIFTIALIAWLYFWILDFIIFFKHHYNNIEAYHCYNLAFLATNVFFLFLVGIVQALSTNKEIGWMEKNKQREDTLNSDH